LSSQFGCAESRPLTILKGSRGEYIGVSSRQNSISGYGERSDSGDFSSFADGEDPYGRHQNMRDDNWVPNSGPPDENVYEDPKEPDPIYDVPPYEAPTNQPKKDPRQTEMNSGGVGEQSSCKRGPITAAQPHKQDCRPNLPWSRPARKEEKNKGFLCRLGGKLTTAGKKILDGFGALGGAYLGLLGEEQSVACDKCEERYQNGVRFVNIPGKPFSRK